MIVSLEASGTNAYNSYAMCPAGQATTVDSIKDVVRSSVKEHIDRNVVEITIKMKDNSPKALNYKNHKLRLRNLDNLYSYQILIII